MGGGLFAEVDSSFLANTLGSAANDKQSIFNSATTGKRFARLETAYPLLQKGRWPVGDNWPVYTRNHFDWSGEISTAKLGGNDTETFQILRVGKLAGSSSNKHHALNLAFINDTTGSGGKLTGDIAALRIHNILQAGGSAADTFSTLSSILITAPPIVTGKQKPD